MKKILLLVSSLNIGFCFADTFQITKYINESQVEQKTVNKTTNFASIYNIDFENVNPLFIKINNSVYSTRDDNVNKLEINATDKSLNLIIYKLEGDMVQNKSFNDFIPWGSKNEMDISISPLNPLSCTQNCDSYKFTVIKLNGN